MPLTRMHPPVFNSHLLLSQMTRLTQQTWRLGKQQHLQCTFIVELLSNTFSLCQQNSNSCFHEHLDVFRSVVLAPSSRKAGKCKFIELNQTRLLESWRIIYLLLFSLINKETKSGKLQYNDDVSEITLFCCFLIS